MIISIAAILAAFGLFIAGFYGYKSYRDREANKMKIVYLNEDGTFSYLFPARAVQLDDLKKILKENASAAGRIRGGESKYSLYIRTDPNARNWQFQEVAITAFYDYGVRKIFISETGSDDWLDISENFDTYGVKTIESASIILENETEITTDVPAGTSFESLANRSFIITRDCCEFRVKLLWCKKGSLTTYNLRNAGESVRDYIERVGNGQVAFKIGMDFYTKPTGEFMLDDFINYIKEVVSDWKPPLSQPELKPPVVIDAREPVEMKHVLRVYKILKSIGFRIFFAGLEVPY